MANRITNCAFSGGEHNRRTAYWLPGIANWQSVRQLAGAEASGRMASPAEHEDCDGMDLACTGNGASVAIATLRHQSGQKTAMPGRGESTIARVRTVESSLTCTEPGGAGIITASPVAVAQAPARLALSECCLPDSEFADLAGHVARRRDLDHRALSVRTLLHLPRVANARGYVSRAQIDRELFFTGRQLRKDINAAVGLISAGKAELGELRFAQIPADQAEAIFSRLHYLRSGRLNSLNFALIDPCDGLPITLCSLSRLEWRRIASQIQARFEVPSDRIWDISRVYSRNGAPPNAISFLLSKVRAALRHSDHDIELFVTAVDPNLGFLGSSYRAANWQQWFTVQARPYLYYERRYISPRQLRQEFGTSNLADLQVKNPGRRFEQSRAKLADSKIFCCRLNGPTEQVLPHRLRR